MSSLLRDDSPAWRFKLPGNHPMKLDVKPEAIDFEAVTDKLVETPELVSEWISGAASNDFDERQSCKFWGPISTQQLIEVGMTGRCTPSQAQAIWEELRRRFVQHHQERIDSDAQDYAEKRLGIY